MIAHRLSTIRNADIICVLEKGGVIAEKGNHDELMEKKGLYFSLLQAQSLATKTIGQQELEKKADVKVSGEVDSRHT